MIGTNRHLPNPSARFKLRRRQDLSFVERAKMVRKKACGLLAARAMFLAVVGLSGCEDSGSTNQQTHAERATKKAPIEPGLESRKAIQRALIDAKPGEVIELAAGRFELNGTVSLDIK